MSSYSKVRTMQIIHESQPTPRHGCSSVGVGDINRDGRFDFTIPSRSLRLHGLGETRAPTRALLRVAEIA